MNDVKAVTEKWVEFLEDEGHYTKWFKMGDHYKLESEDHQYYYAVGFDGHVHAAYKSRFKLVPRPAGSEGKEEWVMTPLGQIHMDKNVWYKVTRRIEDKFYFIGNSNTEQFYYGNHSFQFSPTPPSEEKEVIIGWKLNRDYEYPMGAIRTGVTKTADEWLKIFKELLIGDFAIKTDWFSPVYAPKKPVEEVITINGIDFKIGIGKIEIKDCTGWKKTAIAEWVAFDEQLAKLEKMKIGTCEVEDIVIKIGSNFRRADGKKIIDKYNQLNQ